jgi:integrase/recombinase XerD
MVNQGVSFKDVSDLLGHRHLSTTLIYAKLAMRALTQVALPWPGGER